MQIRSGRLIVLSSLVLLFSTSCGLNQPIASTGNLNPITMAANWKPMVVQDINAVRPSAPPAEGSRQQRDEILELKQWQAKRKNDDLRAIHYWNDVTAPVLWTEYAHELLIAAHVDAPRAARDLALLEAAIYDTTIATWKAKAMYRRPAPHLVEASLSPLTGTDDLPSYPSEHAAIAEAAAAVLIYLFPDKADEINQRAKAGAETRIAAGANYRSDLDAGWRLGAAIAAQVIARGNSDGSDQPATAPIASDSLHWGNANAMEPFAGTWKTWLLTSGSQFMLATPSSPDSSELQDELAEVNREVDSLPHFPWKLEQANYWNVEGPAIMWNRTAIDLINDEKFSTPMAARTLANLNAMMADTFVACWATKYVYLRPRPADLDPTLPARMPFKTPPHPSFPSGHSTVSLVAALYLKDVFPDQERNLLNDANMAAMSRLYAGIHYRSDASEGQALGTSCSIFMLQKLKENGTL